MIIHQYQSFSTEPTHNPRNTPDDIVRDCKGGFDVLVLSCTCSISLSLSLSIPEETTCSTKAVLGSYIQKIFAKLATSNYSPHIRYIASIITSGDTACEISILALRFT